MHTNCPRSIFAALAILAAVAVAQSTAAGPGLRIGPEGAILLDGKPVRAFGINYMSAFTRCLENPGDTSYREGFATLAEHEIPFVRLNFGGFYAVDWSLYRDDPDRHFQLMDGVVRAAEEHGIGLVPSLFWWTACVPDIVGEPRNQWGNPESKTHAFMREYVRAVVTRYVDSPAIWAWEFGNEYSLAADLPNAAEHRPWTHVSRGCPPERGPDDDLTSAMVNTAVAAFAAEVRKYDPHRPITTGHSLPRRSAHHQRVELSWKEDSADQFRENLAFMTPDPADLVSVHIYAHAKERRFGEGDVSYARLLEEASAGAQAAGKGLFVGEFGPPPDNEAPWDHASAKAEGLALLKALEESDAQLAAFWVFDFPWQEAFINVSTKNHRSHYLEALRDANRRISNGGE
ncbi:MAG: cellulase family glycosylhydrolase [Candidatus Hydrogenedentes bacterium]|nr:cellulase family glycosylhydrolase [Candidatus Hydrogenedentota bacterium]